MNGLVPIKKEATPPFKVSYFGIRENGVARVLRLRAGQDPDMGAELDPRLDLQAHSLTGFEWGYAGSGPAQLALALLADFLGDDAAALRLYQPFKRATIARLQRPCWTLSDQDLTAALGRLQPRSTVSLAPGKEEGGRRSNAISGIRS